MANLSLFVPVLLLALFVHEGSCLRCYHCISSKDGGCADPYNAPYDQLKECGSPESENFVKNHLQGVLSPEVTASVPGAEKFCYKFTSRSGVVIRSCLDGSLAHFTDKCLVDISYGCQVCVTDGCNEGDLITRNKVRNISVD